MGLHRMRTRFRLGSSCVECGGDDDKCFHGELGVKKVRRSPLRELRLKRWLSVGVSGCGDCSDEDGSEQNDVG
jgi:hypothetical protein